MIALTILEAFRHAVDLRLAEVAALPEGVQTWMVFMRTMFLVSVVFVYWKKEARVVLAVAAATAILLFGIKTMFPEIHSAEIGRPLHLVLWTPALLYLISRRNVFLGEVRSGRPFSVLYGIWALVVAGVLATSLVLDLAGAVLGMVAPA